MTAERARTLSRRWGWTAVALWAVSVALGVARVDPSFTVTVFIAAGLCYAQRNLYQGWLARDKAQVKADQRDRAEQAWKASR